MSKFATEAIGAFFLVLTIGLTTVEPGGAGALAPLAIGMILTIMVYAGGRISGAHYNPAVTLAVFIRGKCPAVDVVPYIVAQIAGAALAALVVPFLKPQGKFEIHDHDLTQLLIAEALFTFALAYVVLCVATADDVQGNSYYGLAIGMTVMVGAFSVGPISGGIFNPAVAVGLGLMKLISWGQSWAPIAAEFAGAATAALAFRALNSGAKSA